MTSPPTIVLASGNSSKLREIREILGPLPVRVLGLGDLAPVREPLEDGLTFADNARLKALHYARATGHWCLADDSGLVVDALGGAPGVHSARYARDEFDREVDRRTQAGANNARLLRELAGVGPERRTARFVCHLALADRDRVLLEASGSVEGIITDSPRGEGGFGYDPLFLVPEAGLTAAEMTPDRKNALSHRGKAVRAFARMLADLLGRS